MAELPASQCRHLYHGMSKGNLLKVDDFLAVLKDCVYSWGVFLFSLHPVTELGGCIHPQTLEDTLKQTHLVLKWGWGHLAPRARLFSQLLGELKQHMPTYQHDVH